ncbi:tetratricopeptide repeat protein [Gilvimarinus agarilyticus]|uniref:YbgF trimerization domain-containing protein n=1 Tax=unclassified Gilvimarinus TaxID=2642066 RepID=UPI001C0929D0|nr:MULTISPECIES: YbgF trimerization domain-containing protein [unclassified Gilvimarinus]MBU2887375.1 tetratricopeptide repeat protein [Gilvimarinus agarilyticus]MDO6572034.1 YbgF trimerization domain-containing protein [Gilvimarinus sp. 2_MG-2023]MDO6746094.1 YbgF trimerization domain-containing protein [Gilvimarinus sp. 1_MG-2023]
MKNTLLLAAAIAAAVSTAAVAQVQVIDSSPQSVSSPVRGAPVSSGQATEQSEQLFFQLQTLQQEVMNLRGMVEEQSFEIKRLKQQRLDDYLNLDQRISALTTGGSTGGASAVTANPMTNTSGESTQANGQSELGKAPLSMPVTAPSALSQTPTVSDANEADVYGAAYDLLKQRQIDASIEAFKGHLQAYPRGEYASNSYYWLGEIYLLKNNLPEAQRWFGDLLAEFPDSRKVSDAQFKLGKVYHLQGDSARAEELLNIVAASNADASRLAQRYLQDNF